MQLKVFKYEGAGNDFVALDNRSESLPLGEERANLVRHLCDRRRSVGSDGVLLIERPATNADFRMRYYNADGSEGEMCGNGARCIAAFAVLIGAAGETMRFETEAGRHSATLEGEWVEVAFPDVRGMPQKPAVDAWDTDFLVVGVPHAVVWTPDTRVVDVATEGRSLRHHKAFAPAGANVNFATVEADDRIRVRTYERGVEDETLACGTGSTATAICHARRAGLQGPQRITVVPTSGTALEIGFELTDEGARRVTLSGPARLVFVTDLLVPET